MRRILSCALFLLFSASVYSQTPLSETEKIASFCKVWGFLKYYHPVVSKGKLDWDKEFMTRIKSLPSLSSKTELSSFYSEWINSLGKIKDCKKCNTVVPDSLKFNLDLSWMDDSSVFTKSLGEELHYIEKNRNTGKKYYVGQTFFVGNTTYKNEKAYKDSVYPMAEMRLLSLSRYWNIINYFFPYKYLIGEDWNKVLKEMIPKFQNSKDTVDYHLTMAELVARTNDSHAAIYTEYTNQHYGYKWAPFEFKLIEGKVIVIGFYNDSIAKIDDIQYGDVFTKIDGKDVQEIINEESKYIGASNDVSKLRTLSYFTIARGKTDSVNVTFERNGVLATKIIHRYSTSELFKSDKNVKDSTSTFKILEGNIGYVNMGLLKPKQVNKMMKGMMNTKAIIFDVRNYPQGTMYKISKWINKEKKPFVKFTIPELSYPGANYYTRILNCGNKNKNYYKGKVILLFNEDTQSHAEFTCMALQTAPNVVCIGSQTAGADGNVSTIPFPGGYPVWMTGIGVYYPDGRETQRIGIIPDIVVKPTIDGIRNHKDEVLDKAIEVINNGK